jgi:hypothetical protein
MGISVEDMERKIKLKIREEPDLNRFQSTQNSIQP